LVDYAEIHLLVLSDDKKERNEAVDQIKNNFGILLYKEKEQEQVWKDLLILTKDEHSDVRQSAAYTLGPAFQCITDKELATKDLLELTKDENSDVRHIVAFTLGQAFVE